ncbi:hypothetical protein NMY22_g3623 [Coprinellus aureogranulatus]|nr:hypothetical protein NMY22_g3623 [Coprinellus aureogranulatus]
MIQTGLISNAHSDLVTDAVYDFYGLRLATCSLDQRYVLRVLINGPLSQHKSQNKSLAIGRERRNLVCRGRLEGARRASIEVELGPSRVWLYHRVRVVRQDGKGLGADGPDAWRPAG